MPSNKIAGLLNEPSHLIDQRGLYRIAVEDIAGILVLLSDGKDRHSQILPAGNLLSIFHVIDASLAHAANIDSILIRKIVHRFEMTIGRTLDVVILYGYDKDQMDVIAPVFGKSTDPYKLSLVGSEYMLEHMD